MSADPILAQCDRRRGFVIGLLAVSLLWPSLTAAQPLGVTPGAGITGGTLIDQNRLDRAPTLPAPLPVPASQGAAALPPGAADIAFTLRAVQIEGAQAIPGPELAAVWQPRVGERVTLAEILQLSNAVGQLYAARGYALYAVNVPQQDFAGGVLRLRVEEGYVADVTIEGAGTGRDMSLLQTYAARLVGQQPLRSETLERYVLLMNEIPGLKVGSSFQRLSDQPGAVRLRLVIQEQPYEFGSAVNNQGINTLGTTQFELNGSANSLLHQGDRTQLIWLFPASFSRFQYYGLVHGEPIGTEGTRAQVNVGYLTTHTRGPIPIIGDAISGGLTITHPLIRRADQSLTLSGSFDLLDSNNALLGLSLSGERTRSVRIGASYVILDRLWENYRATNAISVVLSQGIDGLDARRGSAFAGGPTFTKVSFRLARDQPLPALLTARLRGLAQYSGDQLPASERCFLGGAEFGRGFSLATIAGDRCYAASLELARAMPPSWSGNFVNGGEVYGFADYGRVWAEPGSLLPTSAQIASAGGGLRIKLAERVIFQVELAHSIAKSATVANPESWRFVVGVRSAL